MTDTDPAAALRARFDAAEAVAARDPFANAHLLFALRTTEALEAGELTLPAIGEAVRALTVQAFLDRAERLRTYLDTPDAARDRSTLTALFEALADLGFDAYAAVLARPPVGVVTTAHPTFALDEALSQALVELATRTDAAGDELSAADRDARISFAKSRPHAPPAELALDVEHAWSVRALSHARDALDVARTCALDVARRRWPDRWAAVSPRLMTVATWVGFDQDGRNDVTWDVSFGKRLELKEAALERLAAALDGGAAPAAQARVARARTLVRERLADLRTADGRPERIAAFARALAADAPDALIDPAPLVADLLGAAVDADAPTQVRLHVLAAGLETHGVGLAHVHVRLNSAQLHNAVRREVGLDTTPADPANRRSYFAAINKLIEASSPQAVNFESLLAEPTTAKALFITIAQMAKFIDATAPVRFLIAETESGFTLLTALYYARLFGVEHLVEISPLFETEEALHRGEAVIEEALKSPHFHYYVRRQGRIALQFGFSDSGRFIGQMAATFRIERLRLRLAELLAREGLAGVEVVLFNTHGDSIGRGGHPASLADRLAYAAPPRDREVFARLGLAAREEDSFQGGDGYLPFFTATAALATVRGLLAFGYGPAAGIVGEADEGEDDPIYAAQDFAAEFFATVQQTFTALGADPDYPALLGLFSTRLLAKTGSRPEKRDPTGGGRVSTLSRVSELRAIPNNAILQGMAQLANTTHGVSRAVAKDPPRFEEMRRRSPRFRRALAMAETADRLSDLQATRAYAATVNPSLWLDRRSGAGADPHTLELVELAESAQLTGRLSAVLRRLRAEPPFPAPSDPPAIADPRRARVRLVHAIRIALIQEAALIATRVPPFAPRLDVTPEGLRLQILRLDLVRAAEALSRLFPAQSPATSDFDYGEPATYVAEERHGYARENETLIQPLLTIHALLLETTAALNHDLGACG